MAHENILKTEKLVDLLDEGGNTSSLSIWRVNLDAFREQNKNARIMKKDKFDRLSFNIKKDKRLEQLPYCMPENDAEGNTVFGIISGHHRIRAARTAGITYIYTLVEQNPLTRSQIASKQLAHNALMGEDDLTILEEIFKDIIESDDKLASGVSDLLDNSKFDAGIKEIEVNLDYELVNFLFLSKDIKNMNDLFTNIEKGSNIYITTIEDFDSYKKLLAVIGKETKIRNITGIMKKLVEITTEHLKEKSEKEEEVHAQSQ